MLVSYSDSLSTYMILTLNLQPSTTPLATDRSSTGDTLSSLVYLCLRGLCEYIFFTLISTANISRILFNVLYCAKVNRDKRNGKYDKYAGYNDDRNPDFKLVL